MRRREILKKYETVINIIIIISKMLPRLWYRRVLKTFRNWDSGLAIFIRYICLKNICKECGNNVAIFSGVYLINPEKLMLGDNISIHPMCYIDATGGICIGNDVSIAHSSTVMSTEHLYDNLYVNIKDQGSISKSTIIEENVWIGAGSRLLAGTTVRRGSIIAAGALVKNEVKQYTIVGGVPAKIIRERTK
jgi:acetyltransferase-like isoleucine patch superfamily enzyme